MFTQSCFIEVDCIISPLCSIQVICRRAWISQWISIYHRILAFNNPPHFHRVAVRNKTHSSYNPWDFVASIFSTTKNDFPEHSCIIICSSSSRIAFTLMPQDSSCSIRLNRIQGVCNTRKEVVLAWNPSIDLGTTITNRKETNWYIIATCE